MTRMSAMSPAVQAVRVRSRSRPVIRARQLSQRIVYVRSTGYTGHILYFWQIWQVWQNWQFWHIG